MYIIPSLFPFTLLFEKQNQLSFFSLKEPIFHINSVLIFSLSKLKKMHYVSHFKKIPNNCIDM